MVITFLIVFEQHILPEIIFKVATDAMNVVSVILGIVILDEQRWAVNTVIMRLPTLNASCPRKVYFLNARRESCLAVNAQNRGAHCSHIPQSIASTIRVALRPSSKRELRQTHLSWLYDCFR